MEFAWVIYEFSPLLESVTKYAAVARKCRPKRLEEVGKRPHGHDDALRRAQATPDTSSGARRRGMRLRRYADGACGARTCASGTARTGDWASSAREVWCVIRSARGVGGVGDSEGE
jgi:hypothetical protein